MQRTWKNCRSTILVCLLLLIGSIVFVMIVELLNTGIEAIVDRVGVEHNELSGRAKDAGSAAVFLSILLSASAWVLLAIY